MGWVVDVALWRGVTKFTGDWGAPRRASEPLSMAGCPHPLGPPGRLLDTSPLVQDRHRAAARRDATCEVAGWLGRALASGDRSGAPLRDGAQRPTVGSCYVLESGKGRLGACYAQEYPGTRPVREKVASRYRSSGSETRSVRKETRLCLVGSGVTADGSVRGFLTLIAAVRPQGES